MRHICRRVNQRTTVSASPSRQSGSITTNLNDYHSGHLCKGQRRAPPGALRIRPCASDPMEATLLQKQHQSLQAAHTCPHGREDTSGSSLISDVRVHGGLPTAHEAILACFHSDSVPSAMTWCIPAFTQSRTARWLCGARASENTTWLAARHPRRHLQLPGWQRPRTEDVQRVVQLHDPRVPFWVSMMCELSAGSCGVSSRIQQKCPFFFTNQ